MGAVRPPGFFRFPRVLPDQRDGLRGNAEYLEFQALHRVFAGQRARRGALPGFRIPHAGEAKITRAQTISENAGRFGVGCRCPGCSAARADQMVPAAAGQFHLWLLGRDLSDFRPRPFLREVNPKTGRGRGKERIGDRQPVAGCRMRSRHAPQTRPGDRLSVLDLLVRRQPLL